METGYIKLWRKFEDWEWYKKPNMAHFYLWLLMRATHKDTRFMGHDIKRGQVVFGLKMASLATGLSRQSIRTCIKALKSTHELTVQVTHSFSIVTILNYNSYQSTENNINTPSNTQTNTQLTHNQHATNNIQEYKNVRKKEKRVVTESEFLDSLRAICLGKGVDFDYESGEMDKWLEKHPERRKTRRFMEGWVKRADPVVSTPGLQITKRATKLQGAPSNPNRIGLAEICPTNSQSSLINQ
jgi:hypothetical protein